MTRKQQAGQQRWPAGPDPSGWLGSIIDAGVVDLLDPGCDDLDGDDLAALRLTGGDPAPAGGGMTADWVAAAPFRAHLRQLITDFGLTWRTIAMLVDVPPLTIERLLGGRHGRPARRLHPAVAARLFRLTADDVRDARFRPVPAGPTTRLLGELAEHGWSAADVARRTGLPVAELIELAGGGRNVCSLLTAATVRAAAQALCRTPGRRPPQPAPSSAPARAAGAAVDPALAA